MSAAQEAVLPLLEAVRHLSYCLSNVVKSRRGQPTPPLDVHLPARMSEIRGLMPGV